MSLHVKELPRLMEELPSLGESFRALGSWMGVSALLKRDWTARQPAVFVASLLLALLLSAAGMQLSDLDVLTLLPTLGIPLTLVLAGGA